MSKGRKREVARRLIKYALLGGFCTYALVCFYFWSSQTDKILRPRPWNGRTPESLEMEFERVSIETESTPGVPIRCFWMPCPSKSRLLATDSKVPTTILFCHGQVHSIGDNLERCQELVQQGFDVLAIDYRGYGESHGEFIPSEASVYADASQALEYLVHKKSVALQQIAVHGHSLGGGIAIELAARTPGLGGLVVESSFTSIQDLTWDRYYGLLRILPVTLLLEHRFDSIQKVPKLQLPTLFIHGQSDSMVPFQMSETLYKASVSPQKDLWLIPSASHVNGVEVAKEEYGERIRKFFGT